MRLLLGGLATALVLAGLTACSADKTASYCDAVKSHRDALSKTLDAGGRQALLQALPTFEALRDKAPSDIYDDWTVVTTALAHLQAALKAAGVDPATYDAAEPPAGLAKGAQDRIVAAATEVGAARTRAALAAVDQQARDVCHAPLTL
ncbi:hypothetical protein [Nocardioides sp. AN3]